MAETDFGALSAARKRVWAADIWKQGRDASFWDANGFVSTGQNSVVQRITELTATERGDKCIMQLVPDLVGDGVAGDNDLTGNEEAMYNDAIELQIDQLRNGVKNRGRMTEQATVIRFRMTARDKLSFWLADKIDEMKFLVASGISFTYKTDGSTRTASQLPSLTFNGQIAAPTTNRKRYAGSATSTATLTSNDIMSWDLVVTTHAFAKRKRMKPIRSGGREYYALLMSTEQCRDLKKDSDYQTNVGRAAERGSNNPLFRGAVAVIDGIVIYDHNKVYNTFGLASSSKWGSGGTVDGAQALLLGAQALGFATIEELGFQEADVNDYGNKPGIAIGQMLGILKPQFASAVDSGTREDFGIVSLYTAAAA